jgi:NADH-quinone oxidoreductase subunit E
MSVRRLDAQQPKSFKFSAENLKWAREQVKKFPKDRKASAVIPVLWRAQEENDGWVSEPTIRYVADFLDMSYIRVYEIATFYTMFNLSPVGRHHVQLCGTTPCWLRGADDLKAVCRKVIGEQGEVTDDGALSWVEVECLGACVNAPMAQINKDFFEDLTAENFEELLEALRAGKSPKPGPQNGRHSSEPEGGALTLIDPELYNGKAQTSAAAKTPKPAKATPVSAPTAAAASGAGKKPRGLKAARRGKADNLRQISGVGPKIEGLLNELGVFHFDQIAKWTADNITWVDGYLKFKGRIAREDWIAQAEILAAGGETEFSSRAGKQNG